MSALSQVLDRLPYREIWCEDFESHTPDGRRPEPICMVARESRTGQTIRFKKGEFPSVCP
jgi:hypothetical protein